jgi:DNA-binding winged helix-turn-helix (wHTH) protein/tetratricopeptide (TPR) repeat protein
MLRWGELEIDPSDGRIRHRKRSEDLEPRVMQVLVTLCQAQHRVVSRDELIDLVWSGRPGADAALTTAVSKLRRAIKALGLTSDPIRTVPKRGYQLRRPPSEPNAVDGPGPSAPAIDLDRESPPRSPVLRAPRRVLLTASLALLLLIGAGLLERLTAPSTIAAAPPRLAMITFAGPDETAFLARGMSEEIRSRLAAHPGLELVNLPEPAGGVEVFESPAFAALEADGVDFVLSGQLRPGATDDGSEALRLAVRLDRVRDRTSLWGDILDIPNAALFDAEQRIADAVVQAVPDLGPLPDAGTVVDTDPLAYRLYVQAIGGLRGHLPTADQVRRAYFQLDRAVELDPEFALAWAAMAVVLSQQERWSLEGIERTARDALQRAEALDPRHPEVLMARGEVQLAHGPEPFDSAPLNPVEPFLDALILQPGSVRARIGLAQALEARGQLSEALALVEATLTLAPRDRRLLATTARLNAATRRWQRAESLMARSAALAPDSYLPWQAQATWRLMRTGDPVQALDVLESAPVGLVPDKVWAEFHGYAGDIEWTLDRAQRRIDEHGVDGFAVQWPVFALHAAAAFRRNGQVDRAIEVANAARGIYVRSLGLSTDDWIARSGMAIADWLAGRPDEALDQGCQAYLIGQERGGATPGQVEEFARVAALTGRLDLARDLIEQLLRVDYGRSPLNRHALRVEPAWQSLREAPGFEAWLEGFPPEPEVVEGADRGQPLDLQAFRPPPTAPPFTIDVEPIDRLCTDRRDGVAARNS